MVRVDEAKNRTIISKITRRGRDWYEIYKGFKNGGQSIRIIGITNMMITSQRARVRNSFFIIVLL